MTDLLKETMDFQEIISAYTKQKELSIGTELVEV